MEITKVADIKLPNNYKNLLKVAELFYDTHLNHAGIENREKK
tara:strand:+ start:1592 stop:1717 length:126 start_codon:yes stop_codon:yes gene_type:complete